MIRYVIHNRLGNQMFSYAFAKAYAKRAPGRLYFFSYLGSLTYFKLSFRDYFINYFIKIIYFLLKKTGVVFDSLFLNDCEVDYSEITFDKNKHVEVTGTFQGDKYFKLVDQELKHLFEIKPKFVYQFKSKFEKLFDENEVIAVHIRRTDYLNFTGELKIGGPDLTLPLSYYGECFSVLSKMALNEKACIILLSDDVDFLEKVFIQAVKKYFPKNQIIISKNNEIVDFQIILNADYCICANSTFSWWASYLNTRRKKVFIPKYFLGFKIKKEYPVNVIPDAWTQVDFN
jgi:hypothetical protein